MALPHGEYPPFLGIHTEPQGYEDAIYGAPVYHCVFPVDENLGAREVAKAVEHYKMSIRPHSVPSMCLVFHDPGTVCTNDFEHRDDLTAEIYFVQNLPRWACVIGHSLPARMDSFMGAAAMRVLTVREHVILYDIDPKLSGRQIAEETRLHFDHLLKKHEIDKLVLRFPNSGTVMVHHYLKEGSNVLSLSTAIQRARRMELPDLIAAVAA